LSILASYTLGKSIDTSSQNGVYPQYPNSNLTGERAISPWDRTHNFVASWVWQVPRPDGNAFLRQLLDWQVTGIATLSSGFPVGVTIATDYALTGATVHRPNKVGDPRLGGSRPLGAQLLQWFNTNAYAANGTGTYGNAPRTDPQLRGPGYANLDFGLLKQFRIKETRQLQFRAEFFNLPNHPNFGMPGTTFGTSAFGKITSAMDPRIIQFALKLKF
jgi:hypothetical protein